MKTLIASIMIMAMTAAGAAIAQDSPIKQRQKLMESNGDTIKRINAMLKGEATYDGAAAAEGLRGIAESLDKFVTLFPEGTEKGSYALPAIWENKADFDSIATKAKEASIKAAAAAPGGLEALQPAVAVLGRSCQACHEKYRRED
jgi:cytochrome c556